MNKKHLASLAMLAGSMAFPLLATATIYLMKGDKVVASFPDDAVEYITFDDPADTPVPTEYDIDTRSYFLYSNYYGDTMLDMGYNYAVQFMDQPADEIGNLPTDAVYFSLLLKGPEVTDLRTPCIPAGKYVVREAGENIILANGNSIAVESGKPVNIKDGWLEVKENGDSWRYEFTGIAEDDRVFHSVFDGMPTAFDQSIHWIDSDIHIQGGTVNGYYLDETMGGGPTGNGCNITVKIAEKGYDKDGWLIMPSNYLTLVGNVAMDEKGNILPGSWTVTDKEYAEENTLLAGTCINFMGIAMPVMSTVENRVSNTDVSVGLIKSGTMTVTENKGMYTFRYDFTTANGKKVTGVFQTPIKVENHPYVKSLQLESDYTVDLTDHKALCFEYSWDKELMLEFYKWDDQSQYLGDRVAFTLKPTGDKIELQPGTYRVNPDNTCVGKIKPGYFNPQNGASSPSVFVKFSDTEAGKVLKASSIKDGELRVTSNDDGTWTFDFEVYDDNEEAPKKISGSWTGTLR